MAIKGVEKAFVEQVGTLVDKLLPAGRFTLRVVRHRLRDDGSIAGPSARGVLVCIFPVGDRVVFQGLAFGDFLFNQADIEIRQLGSIRAEFSALRLDSRTRG